MVNSLSPSEPTVGPSSGPSTTSNTFGNLNFDSSPIGSTSAPSSLRGPTSGSSSGLNSSSQGNSIVSRLSTQPMEENKSSSDSESCSECEDENCDCDASWIELSPDSPSIDVNKMTEKIDNMLTSLSKIDTSTSVGPSLNPGLVDLEQQLITLREDNIRLLSVLEATNDAMKKNLSYAQELKGELKSSHNEYDSLKSSADTAIDQLKADNERLRRRVSELETQLQERNNEPIVYHQFDVPKEMNMQEMTSQIASRDIRISQLMGEINNLTGQLEKTRFDLSRSTGQQSINSADQSHQQLMTFEGNQPQISAPSISSIGDQSNRPNVDENRSNLPNSPTNTTSNGNPGFLQSVLGEMGNLKAMVDLLRGQKQTLESRLAGRKHRSSHRNSHRHQPPTMGTSYSANTDQDLEQSSGQPGNMESDPSDPQYHHHPHGRHRRHHRHHASKALRRLEKKMARTSLPVVNSAIMFQGFTSYSNQQQ